LPIDSIVCRFFGDYYLNTDICKFESSQKEQSGDLSADSSKAYSKPRAVKSLFENVLNSLF